MIINLKIVIVNSDYCDYLRKQLEVDMRNSRNTILQVFKEKPAKHLYQKVGFEIYEETSSHYKMRRLV